MSDNTESTQLINGNNSVCDLLWGTAAIGKAINRNPRQVFHLISTGALKSIQKKGGRYSTAPMCCAGFGSFNITALLSWSVPPIMASTVNRRTFVRTTVAAAASSLLVPAAHDVASRAALLKELAG